MTRNDKEIWKHIETTNREMGEVQTDIKWIKTELKSTKQWIKWMFGLSITIWLGIVALMVI